MNQKSVGAFSRLSGPDWVLARPIPCIFETIVSEHVPKVEGRSLSWEGFKIGTKNSITSVSALSDPLDVVSWTVEFANTELTEANWKDHLWDWFQVSLEDKIGLSSEFFSSGSSTKTTPRWHFGGVGTTLAHIRGIQESTRDTLGTLANRGTVPREVIERVNSYLMGLHGFKFHIITEFPSRNQCSREVETTPEFSPSSSPLKSNSKRAKNPNNQKGIQPQTLRLEPKTYDLRSLFYYKISLFLISAAAQRIRKCRQCEGYFIQRFNHRKLYCSDLCRFRSHNQSRKRKDTADQASTTPNGNDALKVWWRKYEEAHQTED